MLQSAAPRHSLRLRRDQASRKRLLHTRSLWDALMDLTRPTPPTYREYSYALRADIYVSRLNAAQLARFTQEAARHSTRSLRAHLPILSSICQLVFVCPRPARDGRAPRSS
jgi:hypothetical protein